MYCKDQTLVKHEPGVLTVTPLRCKCWHCRDCGPMRCRELRWKARSANPSIFLTLTIRKGTYATPDEQAREFAKGWRMLRQYLMRELGWSKLAFLCVIEKHKSGWPHMHLLIRSKYIPHQLIRAFWIKRFNSPIIDIKQITSKAMAAVYISKYMAKDPQKYDGTKRYWCSQDWDLIKKEKEQKAKDLDVFYEIALAKPGSIAVFAYQDGAHIEWKGEVLTITGWLEKDRHRWGMK